MKKVENIRRGGVITVALVSVIKAMAFTAAALLLLTVFIAYKGMPESAAMVCIKAATFLCVFTAGLFTSRKMGKSGWLSGLVSGVIYVLAMALISFFILGSFRPDANTFKMLIISVLAGVLGGITGVNIKRKKKYF
ncbi:MAG: TIGR04086 family membrane protein [Clostridia bacterium]|nr:TIGR04086 family membrane protein [Clostridia bacterium]